MKPLTPRKPCPACGHANKINAKVCTQCGHAFVLIGADGTIRKACSACGHANRLTAQVCSQCGHAFAGLRPGKLLRRKWCPQCGTERKLGAKVCTQCGFHFKTAPAEAPVVPAAKPPIVLPPTPDNPAVLPPQKSHAGLEGEPSPFVSSDELDRLRGSGPYSPSLVERMTYRLTRKSNS
ncbi:MAG: zinc ribbon domain-containing protein [Chloroflexota bacterium]